MKRCKHCPRPATRPRGLCRKCYFTPGIRRKYKAAATNVPKPKAPRRVTTFEQLRQRRLENLSGQPEPSIEVGSPMQGLAVLAELASPEISTAINRVGKSVTIMQVCEAILQAGPRHPRAIAARIESLRTTETAA